MLLKDTVVLMNSEDFKERFRAEYYQLENRMAGLKNMLEKYREGTLNFTPKCSYELLHAQLECMEQYAEILVERADVEGVTL